MEVSKTPKKKEDTTMKRKKFLALALAGVMTAVTLTACAPLEDLYDWFFGGGSGSASRGNGMNLVEVSPGQKSQIVHWFGLNDGDVTTTDRSRKALEEAVGKLDVTTMMNSDKTELNATVQNAMNGVAKNQLLLNNGMCIDVMKQPPASAAEEAPDGRRLYWAEYTDHGDGGNFVVGGEPGASSYETYKSEWGQYVSVKSSIGYRVRDSKVDLFAATFTKNGETYLGVVALWKSTW